MTPLFLTLDEIVEIHKDQLERYGGSEGIRSSDLLQSALAMPSAGFGDDYFHEEIYDMAAAYLFHLVKNHPFVDGNKRVGVMAAYVFLSLNGFTLTADEKQFEKLVLDVVASKKDKKAIANFFRINSKRSK